MSRLPSILASLVFVSAAACGGDDSPGGNDTEEGSSSSGGGTTTTSSTTTPDPSASTTTASTTTSTTTGTTDDTATSGVISACTEDSQCDDGLFCNGAETCDPSSEASNSFGCVGAVNPCEDDEVCQEDVGECIRQCELDPDVDDDGVDAIACGGLDCDDNDDTRSPDNNEICDGFDVDNDCDPLTLDDDIIGDWAHCSACGDACVVQQACEGASCVAARRVFLSSTQQNGNMGGAAGADAICQGLADAAELGGTWLAYLVDSSNGLNRHSQADVPYVRLDGVRVANNWADLSDESILAQLNYTETRQTAGGNVWTGLINVGGTGNDDCDDWTYDGGGCLEGSACGGAGQSGNVNENWDGFYIYQCASNYRLYCIEQ